MRGATHRVPGQLVHLINPAIATNLPGHPYYIFQSDALCTIGASILETLTAEDGRSIPTAKESDHFPYCEMSGTCSLTFIFHSAMS